MRQYGDVPPVLAADNTPAVSAVTGLGTGGGACVQTPDSGGYGSVQIFAGVGVAKTGTIALTFPSTPPTLFIAADEEVGTLAQATVGKVVTITFSNAFMMGGNSMPYHIHYEWDVSK